MVMTLGRVGAVSAFALVTVTALAACSAPDGGAADGAGTSGTAQAVETPAPIDPASAGITTGEDGVLDSSALADFPNLAAAAQQCGDGSIPTDGSAPATSIEIVQAGRQVLGVRCEGGQTFYTDAVDGSTWASSDLLTDGAGEAIAAAIGKDQVSLTDLRFDAQGDLLVVGDETWEIPAATVTPYLTDAGRVVRGAARSGGAFTGAVASGAAQPGAVVAASLPAPLTPEKAFFTSDVDCSVSKCVALTFDDGPSPYTTPELLKTLEQKGVAATFFMIGKNVKAYPDVAKQVADAGHEVAVHTWSHPDLTKQSAETIRSQMADTVAAIEDATGVTPVAMRPPYGAQNQQVRDIAGELGMSVILWDVDTEDWKNLNTQTTTERALAGTRNGSIVLQHDIHAPSVAAVPGIIDSLRAQGYEFVTVEQLLDSSVPGQRYFDRGSMTS